MKQILPIFLVFAAFSLAKAQIGGDNVYEFLNFSSSARITAMGNNLITVRDDDSNLAYFNPAVLNASMHQQISVSHQFHLSGIQHGFASYAHHVEPWDLSLHGGLQYVSYGTFDMTNQLGIVEGQFKAAEYAFVLGGGKQLYERLSVGANLKVITSQLESYNSFGITGDVAATFFDTAKNFTATLLFKNIGGQLSTYRPDNREAMPFEAQIGFSQKLRYLPFRFSVIYQHLNRWNILYDDPNQEETVLFIGEGEQPDSGNPFLDNLFRHFVFNGEFLFGRRENFRIRAGYNHLLKKELSVANYRSLAGFSFGVGIKINRFRIDYGHGFYHLAGGLNHFTISTNLKEFTNRRVLD